MPQTIFKVKGDFEVIYQLSIYIIPRYLEFHCNLITF